MENCQAVIFDFGQVLVRFEPSVMVAPFLDPADADFSLLCSVLFDRKYWDRLDDGTITHEEILFDVAGCVPARLLPAAALALDNWQKNLPEIEGMRELIGKIKKAGRKLYLLSNISRHFAEHSSDVPILRLFDGCVFSAEVGAVKPSREIFSLLCSRYGLDKSRVVFIDDSEKNVRGAGEFGIRAFRFTGNAADAETFLTDQKII